MFIAKSYIQISAEQRMQTFLLRRLADSEFCVLGGRGNSDQKQICFSLIEDWICKSKKCGLHSTFFLKKKIWLFLSMEFGAAVCALPHLTWEPKVAIKPCPQLEQINVLIHDSSSIL